MIEAIVLTALILLCVGWAIKLDCEGEETMATALMFGCIAIGILIANIFL